jgi:UDP-glucose 4-epimerase
MSKKYLVIGGAGYIGSHFVETAIQSGHSCVVYDNLSRGHAYAVPTSVELINGDILDQKTMAKAIAKHNFDAVLHFAAYALVGESKIQPDIYYRNNVDGVLTLLEVLVKDGRKIPLIFSSTCAVFGTPSSLPVDENAAKNPVSPYGRSKLMAEWVIEDFCESFGLRSVVLRYFNACGASNTGTIGEDHEPETHLIPNAIKAALHGESLHLYGIDHPTPDGTCVRDYIHVLDLARAHILAASFAETLPSGSIESFNLGNNKPISNFEIIKTVEKISGKKISLIISPQRPGDPAGLYADNSKAQNLLKFTPQLSIDDAISSAVFWHSLRNKKS